MRFLNVFIAGPRAIRSLNKKVKKRLDTIINNNFTVLVGDAAGIDKQIQSYCDALSYENVKVFAANGKARNNIGKWTVQNVTVPPNVKGFDFYATKDLEMAKQANYGFMIWNGKSRGTYNNILNLIKLEKKVLVYMTTDQEFYTINTMPEAEQLKAGMIRKDKHEKTDTVDGIEQLTLFN